MSRRILVVEGGQHALRALREALAAIGLEVEVAQDGFYATLLLERQKLDAVVTAPRLPDMEAGELARILGSDPALDEVKRILVPLSVEDLPGSETVEQFDLVLPPGLPPERLAALVAAALAPGTLPARREASLSGSLAAVDFAELTQALERSRRTGLLRIRVAEAEGAIYFSRGQVIHCTFGRFEGSAGFTALVWEAGSGHEATFRFDVLPMAEVFRQPRTVSASVQSLLLTAVTEIDETRRGGISGG